MTDFLSGLLDRALNRAPVLQPRRPSLFEPSPAAALLPALSMATPRQQGKEKLNADPENQEMFESNEMRESVIAFEAPLSRRRASSLPSSLQENLGQTAVPVAPLNAEDRNAPPEATIGAVKKPTSRTAAVSARPHASEIPAEEDGHEIKVEKDQPKDGKVTRLRSTPRHAPVDAEREQSLVRLRTWPNQRNQSQSQQPAVHQVEPVAAKILEHRTVELAERTSPSSTVLEQGAVHSVKRASPPSSVPVFPLSRPGLPLRPTQPAMVPETQPIPPAIHVTIGRIEVRGTAPAPVRTPAPRPAAPKLNLEDYLRSRNGGAK